MPDVHRGASGDGLRFPMNVGLAQSSPPPSVGVVVPARPLWVTLADGRLQDVGEPSHRVDKAAGWPRAQAEPQYAASGAVCHQKG
ncbi:hypothetical protein BE21_25790 [Sorangium cellulosum]|uniref:Uncharacterized protein n=1 Tax=Sorangium cellulosum TaxID=56 RepID=A0A150TUA4_SORCE|nr:hypothetical protein BE21_25790 [Sorangium cellulosum]